MEDQSTALPERWRTPSSDTGPLKENEDAAHPKLTASAQAAMLHDVRADEMETQMKLGQELAALFKDKNVHPVLIFGSGGSGKTSLLASLFRYMQLPEAHATISLHDTLFPLADQRWLTHITWARQLFYGKVLDFIRRQAPKATLDPTPFFIPVKVTQTTGEESLFAFLEGRGEWYMPTEQGDVPFRPFQALLQGLLQTYNGEATVVYIAPFTTGVMPRDGQVEAAGTPELRRSDLGLLGAIREYVSLRRATFHRDYHLFLMTKWDICCGGISEPDFVLPSMQQLHGELKERFPLSWAHFNNLNFQGSTQNKMFSSYCAGVIDNMTVLPPASADAAIVDFYPRKLWNRLYENHMGTPLYPDVCPRKPGLIDRFIEWLRS